MFCTNCGKPLHEGDRFCAACGARVRETVPAGATEIPDDWNRTMLDPSFTANAVRTASAAEAATTPGDSEKREEREKAARVTVQTSAAEQISADEIQAERQAPAPRTFAKKTTTRPADVPTGLPAGGPDFSPAFMREDARPGRAEQTERRPAEPLNLPWNLDGFPTETKKKEDIEFNWSSVLEQRDRRRTRDLDAPGQPDWTPAFYLEQEEARAAQVDREADAPESVTEGKTAAPAVSAGAQGSDGGVSKNTMGLSALRAEVQSRVEQGHVTTWDEIDAMIAAMDARSTTPPGYEPEEPAEAAEVAERETAEEPPHAQTPQEPVVDKIDYRTHTLAMEALQQAQAQAAEAADRFGGTQTLGGTQTSETSDGGQPLGGTQTFGGTWTSEGTQSLDGTWPPDGVAASEGAQSPDGRQAPDGTWQFEGTHGLDGAQSLDGTQGLDGTRSLSMRGDLDGSRRGMTGPQGRTDAAAGYADEGTAAPAAYDDEWETAGAVAHRSGTEAAGTDAHATGRSAVADAYAAGNVAAWAAGIAAGRSAGADAGTGAVRAANAIGRNVGTDAGTGAHGTAAREEGAAETVARGSQDEMAGAAAYADGGPAGAYADELGAAAPGARGAESKTADGPAAYGAHTEEGGSAAAQGGGKDAANTAAAEAGSAASTDETQPLSIEELERVLFQQEYTGPPKGNENTAQLEQFYTYNQKREAFQELLDQECAKLQDMQAARRPDTESLDFTWAARLFPAAQPAAPQAEPAAAQAAATAAPPTPTGDMPEMTRDFSTVRAAAKQQRKRSARGAAEQPTGAQGAPAQAGPGTAGAYADRAAGAAVAASAVGAGLAAGAARAAAGVPYGAAQASASTAGAVPSGRGAGQAGAGAAGTSQAGRSTPAGSSAPGDSASGGRSATPAGTGAAPSSRSAASAGSSASGAARAGASGVPYGSAQANAGTAGAVPSGGRSATPAGPASAPSSRSAVSTGSSASGAARAGASGVPYGSAQANAGTAGAVPSGRGAGQAGAGAAGTSQAGRSTPAGPSVPGFSASGGRSATPAGAGAAPTGRSAVPTGSGAIPAGRSAAPTGPTTSGAARSGPTTSGAASAGRSPAPSGSNAAADQAHEQKAKLRYSDIFPREAVNGADGAADGTQTAEGAKKHRIPLPVRIILIILLILIIGEAGILAVQHFAPDTALAVKTKAMTEFLLEMIGGSDTGNDDEPDGQGGQIAPPTYITEALTQVELPKTIAKMAEDASLTYDLIETPAFEEIPETTAFAGEENETTVEILTAVATYYGDWNPTEADSSLVGINTLEFGQIRRGAEGYYVLCRLTMATDTGEERTQVVSVYLKETGEGLLVNQVTEEKMPA